MEIRDYERAEAMLRRERKGMRGKTTEFMIDCMGLREGNPP